MVRKAYIFVALIALLIILGCGRADTSLSTENINEILNKKVASSLSLLNSKYFYNMFLSFQHLWSQGSNFKILGNFLVLVYLPGDEYFFIENLTSRVFQLRIPLVADFGTTRGGILINRGILKWNTNDTR